MALWDYNTPPKWFPTAVATANGWSDPVTGELLVAITALTTKKADAVVIPTFGTLAVPADGTYTAGQVLTFTLTPSEGVDVVGTPWIAVTIGTEVRQAMFDRAASTATSLKFSYTVVAGEVDANGIIVNNSVKLGDNGVKGKNRLVDQITGTRGVVIPELSLTFTVPSTSGILVA